jgi:ubiquinone/menaquinone biosynthesis C-methylase UbiE
MNAKVDKLLKYGTTYADDNVVLPPVGYPVDFIDKGYLATNSYWQAPDLEEHIRRDRSPIPHEKNREGYCPGYHLGYWLSGYADYQKTLQLVHKYGVTNGRYFDFGGSTGRVFRHFAFQSDKWDVWSSDFKLSSVEWNLLHLPNQIKVFANNSNPSLPLPDQYFNLVTGYSVFTHINEPETHWLAELRRVLKVGGIAYLTVHDEATWADQSASLRSTVEKFRPDIANSREMPCGKTVVTFRMDDPYNCNVFHSRDYLYRVWGRFFEITEIQPFWVGKQAVVVCRKLTD